MNNRKGNKGIVVEKYFTEEIRGEDIEKILVSFYPYYKEWMNNGLDFREYTKKVSKYAECYVVKNRNNVQCGVIAFYANDRKNYEAYVTTLVVDEKYRGKGLTKLLLDECQRISKLRGMKCIVAEINRNNLDSIRCFSKVGFIRTDITKEQSFFYYKKL